jgi:dolichol kinase
VAFKGLIAAATSAALILAPTMAAAQPPAAASASVTREVAPAAETVEGSELRGGFIIPLIALIAIILGLCVATNLCGGDDDELPHSP